MSQQEFEPREQQSGYQARSSYNQAGRREEGMPKDEPPGAYGAPANQFEQENYQHYQTPAQVPWWARPQPQQFSRSGFMGVVVIMLLIILVMGGLGIAGIVLGALAHVIGLILGAIFALLIFVCVLIMLILSVIWRAIGNATGYDRHGRHDMRRAAHDARRMVRRAARRY